MPCVSEDKYPPLGASGGGSGGGGEGMTGSTFDAGIAVVVGKDGGGGGGNLGGLEGGDSTLPSALGTWDAQRLCGGALMALHVLRTAGEATSTQGQER